MNTDHLDRLVMLPVYIVIGAIVAMAVACFIGAAIIEFCPKYRRVIDETPKDGLEDKRTLLERVQ